MKPIQVLMPIVKSSKGLQVSVVLASPSLQVAGKQLSVHLRVNVQNI